MRWVEPPESVWWNFLLPGLGLLSLTIVPVLLLFVWR